MYLRSYLFPVEAKLSRFTLDAVSSCVLDHSDNDELLGLQPVSGDTIHLRSPSHQQSNEKRIRNFVDNAALASVEG